MSKARITKMVMMLFGIMLIGILAGADQKKTTNPPPAKPAPAAPAEKQAQPVTNPVQKPNPQPPGPTTIPHPGPTTTPHPGPTTIPHPGPTTATVPIKGGGMAQVRRRADGRVSDIHANGMSIHQNARGGRTIVGEHNGRTVVNTGRQGGYVQRPYTVRNGRTYYQRTYVAGGRSYARVYRGYEYRGVRYYGYVPARYYRPVFYGWAYNPWVSPVYFGPAAWGWAGAPWFAMYGGYFTPYPVYPSASFWLTDYLMAANLQAAYQAQAEANAGAGPGATAAASERGPESGLAFVPVLGGARLLAQGFSAAGSFDFADDRLILRGGATTAFSLSVPPGQVQTVAYGIPTGSYVNNTQAEVSVNGVTVAMINQGLGGIGATTPTQLLLWQKSFGPGDYAITIRSGGLINYYGLWLGQEAAGQQLESAETGATAPTPLSPEVKQAIADEVQQQLAADQQAAATPQPAPQAAPTAAEVPDALNPAERVFVVASNLDVTMASGQECALSAGDVVMRLTDSPDANQNVNASIQSSKKGDCATGQTVAVGVQDLQEMHNQFRAQLDSGLQQLGASSGKGGLPKAPDTATTAGEVPPPEPDPGAAAQLAAQQQQADQTQAQLVD